MRGDYEAEVLSRIEATRERMGHTIEQIGDRVNPDRVQRELKDRAREQVREAKDNVKGKARDAMRGIEHEVTDAGRGVWHTIKNNPVPAGMAAIGLAWLVANRDSGDEPRRTRLDDRSRHLNDPMYGEPRPRYVAGTAGAPAEPYPPTYYGEVGGRDEDDSESMRERAGHMAHEAQDKASHMAHEAQDKASHLAHEAQNRASHMVDEARHMAHQAQDRASDMAHDVADRARRAEHRAEDMVRDHPLAAGMVAAALGFAAGLAIPESRREHELMGRTRDKALDQARDALHNARDSARDAISDAAGESTRRAVDHALGGDDVRDDDAMIDPDRR